VRPKIATILLFWCACGGPREAGSPASPVASSSFEPRPLVEDTRDEPAPAPPPLLTRSRTIGAAEPAGPKYRGRAIDLDVKNADIHEVCRLLADVGKVNIVVSDGVRGTVTVRMKHVPWDQALDVILRAKGFHAERDGAVLLVVP
jgi:hypothetical protein